MRISVNFYVIIYYLEKMKFNYCWLKLNEKNLIFWKSKLFEIYWLKKIIVFEIYLARKTIEWN